MLKAECGGLWTVGSAFALLADLFKFSPTRLVQCLLQADAHGGSGSMPELEKLVRALPSSLHDHATAEERVGYIDVGFAALADREDRSDALKAWSVPYVVPSIFAVPCSSKRTFSCAPLTE